MKKYFIKLKGVERGPYDESQLRCMRDNGIITSDTVFLEHESKEWRLISNLFEREEVIEPPPIPPQRKPKRSTIALVWFFILFVILIGWFIITVIYRVFNIVT
jgi:hypothetical protein